MTDPVDDSEELRELKHSVRIHILLHAGPSPQLAAFLVKTIDFLEDKDPIQRKQEMLDLAFNMIEAIAVYTQRTFDDRIQKGAKQGREASSELKARGDNILVVLGKSRSLPDRIAAKNAVLRVTAEAMDALGVFMQATYPTLHDSVGNPLNNLDKTDGEAIALE